MGRKEDRTGQGGKDGQSVGRQLCQSGQGDAERRMLHSLHQLLCCFVTSFLKRPSVKMCGEVLRTQLTLNSILLAVEVTRLSTEQ